MTKIEFKNYPDTSTPLSAETFNQMQQNIENEFEIVKENIEDTLLKVYPIGSIYVSVNSTNPSELFGGTWERFANGKVLVGVDEEDTDFNEVEKEGGEKEHMHYNGVYSIDNKLAVSNKNALNSGSGEQIFSVNGTSGFTSIGSANVYKYASESESSLQPYITCYMWKRTA